RQGRLEATVVNYKYSLSTFFNLKPAAGSRPNTPLTILFPLLPLPAGRFHSPLFIIPSYHHTIALSNHQKLSTFHSPLFIIPSYHHIIKPSITQILIIKKLPLLKVSS